MKRFGIVMCVAACGPIYPQQTQQQQPQWQPLPQPQPQPQPQPGPGTGAGTTTAQRFVDAHNAVRAKHCAGPLTWSAKLAGVAQQWADALRDQGCKFGHSGGNYGENLAAGTIGGLDPEATVAMWYAEVKDYSFSTGEFSMKTGHFTQVVWRGTTQVGCGHSQCNGNDIWVCEYDPYGNVEGAFHENVRQLGC